MSDTLETLIAQVRRLAGEAVIMQVDEVQLATRLSMLPDPRITVRAMMELLDDQNTHVRRMAITTCRRIGVWEEPGLVAALTARLQDDDPMTRAEAAKTLQELGV